MGGVSKGGWNIVNDDVMGGVSSGRWNVVNDDVMGGVSQARVRNRWFALFEWTNHNESLIIHVF